MLQISIGDSHHLPDIGAIIKENTYISFLRFSIVPKQSGTPLPSPQRRFESAYNIMHAYTDFLIIIMLV